MAKASQTPVKASRLHLPRSSSSPSLQDLGRSGRRIVSRFPGTPTAAMRTLFIRESCSPLAKSPVDQAEEGSSRKRRRVDSEPAAVEMEVVRRRLGDSVVCFARSYYFSDWILFPCLQKAAISEKGSEKVGVAYLKFLLLIILVEWQ